VGVVLIWDIDSFEEEEIMTNDGKKKEMEEIDFVKFFLKKAIEAKNLIWTYYGRKGSGSVQFSDGRRKYYRDGLVSTILFLRVPVLFSIDSFGVWVNGKYVDGFSIKIEDVLRTSGSNKSWSFGFVEGDELFDEIENFYEKSKKDAIEVVSLTDNFALISEELPGIGKETVKVDSMNLSEQPFYEVVGVEEKKDLLISLLKQLKDEKERVWKFAVRRHGGAPVEDTRIITNVHNNVGNYRFSMVLCEKRDGEGKIVSSYSHVWIACFWLKKGRQDRKFSEMCVFNRSELNDFVFDLFNEIRQNATALKDEPVLPKEETSNCSLGMKTPRKQPKKYLQSVLFGTK
jgi:hypothetical protein